MDVEAFIAATPKVELHLHLVGSASPETLAKLAEGLPEVDVPRDAEGLRRMFEFRDFPHFIEVYTRVNDLVRTAGDVATLVRGAVDELRSHSVRYAEMTVTPYMHELCGLPAEAVAEGLDDGRRAARESGMELAWIYDIPGEHGQPGAVRTLQLALEEPPDGLVGLGLAGAEAGVSRSDYAWAFERASAAGLRSLPHAGEGDGPASVWAAINDLHADRIGHGVRAIEDPHLVAVLAERRIPLDVCPTSNICTRVYERLEDHPIKDLMDAGAIVTVNTDDPHMFGTNLSEEYHRLAATFGFDVRELASLVVNGIDAAFLPQAEKRRLRREVEELATGPA